MLKTLKFMNFVIITMGVVAMMLSSAFSLLIIMKSENIFQKVKGIVVESKQSNDILHQINTKLNNK